MPYVITEPESIKGVCETWDECRSKFEGVKGAKYQKVHDEAEAQALLKGTGVVLKPGLHVFTDGNQRGGVGVVIVWMSENPSDAPTVVAEIATSVGRIFYGGVVPALGSEKEVEVALEKSRHVLAELGGLYLALWQAGPSESCCVRISRKPVAETQRLPRSQSGDCESGGHGEGTWHGGSARPCSAYAGPRGRSGLAARMLLVQPSRPHRGRFARSLS